MTARFRAAIVLASFITIFSSAASAATITLFDNEAAFNAAVTSTLIEDFEAFLPKDTTLPGLVSNGITYVVSGSATNVLVASPGYVNFGAGVGTTTTSILTASGDEDFFGIPAVAPFAVGFDVYLNGLGPATATFLNGMVELGHITFPADAADIRFAGILSDVPVTSFHWTSTLGGELNTGIDNVAFGSQVQAVPEPATMLLVGSGLIAAARRRRTRK
jgi:hypothetical protein